jgi:UDP-perosamine 4-acetyltransferase
MSPASSATVAPVVDRSGVVVGAGGHALVCIEVLRRMGHDIAGCVSSDGRPGADLTALGVDMIGTDRDLEALLTPDRWAFVAIGDSSARRSLVDRVTSLGAELVSAISPDALVSPTARIAAGSLVMPGAVVNAAAQLGVGSIVNTGAIVDHECSIGAFAHVAPGVSLAGGVTIGDGALVGIGSTVLPGRSIGPGAVVGAGAVVVTDVDADTTVVGVPARTVASAPPRDADGIRPADDDDRQTAPGSLPEPGPPAIPKVLVVCTGNLNRSPLVEVLLRKRLDEIGVTAEVVSAGLAAPIGSPVDGKLLRVARELGVGDEIEAHRSTQITPAHLAAADLVLAMTREHLDELARFGAVSERSTTLRTAAWRSRVMGRRQIRFDEWVARLTAELPESARTNGASAEDIADPIGGRLRQYRAMGAEVNELVGTLVDHWGGR